jgi:MATE family multidrug resistance protein
VVSVWCFTYDGIFIGATKTKAMMLNMLAATFLVFIPAVFVLRTFGNHGLWAAFMLFLIARALFLHRDREKLFEF